MRYFIEVQYIGTKYSGFQIQPNGNTIQSEVNNALSILLKHNVETTTSSRTDAGVHAIQNYLHFDTEIIFDCKRLYNLNSILPLDIVAKKITAVNNDAHCRFDAQSRSYKYLIHTNKQPFSNGLSYFFPYTLNKNKLDECCKVLLKHTDFTSFSKKHTQVNNFNCTILKNEWKQTTENNLEFTITANRFLRGMVRAIVSTMLLVARGKITVQEFENIILAKDCTHADFSAPGCGLYLEKLEYNWEKIQLTP